jgi:hypothetical protein
MRGGSQSVLLRCSDENYYVVKMKGNPQGTDVLGREFLGTMLCDTAGITVSPAAGVVLSRTFIEKNPDIWFESRQGQRIRPTAGIHFGSRLVGDPQGTQFPTEYLSPSRFPSIANRAEFLKIWVLDVWAMHRDQRQAVFTEDPKPRTLKAHFIDHGFMFNPDQSTRENKFEAFYREKSIYRDLWQTVLVEGWIDHFRQIFPTMLPSCLAAVPREWYAIERDALVDQLLLRLDRLSDLIEPYADRHVKRMERMHAPDNPISHPRLRTVPAAVKGISVCGDSAWV